MGLYEGLFIVQPDLGAEAQKAVFTQIEEPIAKQGGTIETAQEWGRRNLRTRFGRKKKGFIIWSDSIWIRRLL